ncbi:MAG: peroxidase family protein [Shimia sp.]
MASRCPFLAQLEQQPRLTEANYADGLSEGIVGANPHDIASTVFDQDGDMPNSAGLSTLFTTWGQFLDHDLVLTPEDENHALVVNGEDQGAHASEAIEGTGVTTAKEVGNAITWQIDGSQIYGSSDERIEDVRSFEGGKLAMSDDPTSTHGLLPLTDGDDIMAGESGGEDAVYLAGDVRANENPNLLSMHTLWAREHNYWAERLAEAHPDWDDEQLFQGARQIVEYELQKITYDEWLPLVIGDALPTEIDYDADVDGEVSVEFSTAAFRFGHTAVSSSLNRVNDDGTEAAEGHLGLMDAFFDAAPVKEHGIDSLLRGQTTQLAQEIDAKVVDDLNGGLENPDGEGGFSLPAFNIARGADHGLPSYVDAREALIGDIVAADLDPTDFSIITSNPDTQAELAAVYDTVHDVDMWVGGLAEDKIAGTQAGPLFTEIMVEQFTRTAAADEGFGTLDPELGADIIADVESSTMSDVILRTTDIDTLQENAFLASDRSLDLVAAVFGTSGDDVLDLSALDVEGDVAADAGNDALMIVGGTRIAGQVDTGTGSDAVAMSSGSVGADIRTGHGAEVDMVALSGTAVIGDDIVTFAGNDVVLMEDVARVTDDIWTGRGNDHVEIDGKAQVDGIVGTQSGHDTVVIGGEAQVGMVATGSGSDVVFLVFGADVGALAGGAGFDVLEITGGRFIVDWDGGDPSSRAGQVTFVNSDDEPIDDPIPFTGFESVTAEGSNDTMTGSDGDDVMMGGSGDDVMQMGAGDDYARGDAGADDMYGGEGDDTLVGADGPDTMRGEGGNDSMRGGAQEDVMMGGEGNDRMSGRDGDDALYGGDGRDLMTGGLGDDGMFGQAGNDRISGQAGDDTISGGDGDDRVQGAAGDDDVRGGRGDDTVMGGEGNDTLQGDQGDDVLYADEGDDQLTGGEGADLFRFSTDQDGENTIRDYEAADTIRIERVSEDEIIEMLTSDEGHTVITSSENDAWRIIVEGEALDEDDLDIV